MEEKLLSENCNPKELSPHTLAFVGDGVYDLLVREYLVSVANRPVGELNKRKISMVCCKSQAERVKILMEHFTPEETAVYKRGRNATVNNVPKNSSKADYHSATGLEAVFGYLYLQGNINRVTQLFQIIIDSFENNNE